ncbi:putative phosphoglycerate mutase [Stackebrandtia albiflava]|uniref:Putative phosphoglycerate mutase n=1 Tax=Stackebrandtia albiflava TaxID=406432 RepID=A0A562VA44_9ACTN|nr:histidine phosphatase family protein [Stackebrandtia albiflava]TWJ14756.1 putative phosphoglycerate mutase [Stackebrandtia albiflava]
MATRHLYIARHGDADALGVLTDTGRAQARLLGRRLAHLPVDAVWHSPLPRARDTARELDIFLGGTAPVAEAAELIDHIPYVPTPEETPPSWIPFFDGYRPEEAAAGDDIARSLTARFATPPDKEEDVHEIVITHAYPIAWLVRDALDAPPVRWLGLSSANTGLTVIEYRPGGPPGIAMYNDMSHLPPELRWTGFPGTPRP